MPVARTHRGATGVRLQGWTLLQDLAVTLPPTVLVQIGADAGTVLAVPDGAIAAEPVQACPGAAPCRPSISRGLAPLGGPRARPTRWTAIQSAARSADVTALGAHYGVVRSTSSDRTQSPTANRGTRTSGSGPPRGVNVYGVVVTAVVSTAGQGARAAGLTVLVRGDHLTDVAVCTYPCSFGLRARQATGSVRPAGWVSADVVDEIASHVVSFFGPPQ